MAEIKPFRAWRYRPSLLENIGELTSPLFDVASEKQREALYGNSFNSIHLSIPRGDQPAKNAATTFAEWKRKKVIIRDEVPGIYVYYQYFSLPSDPKPYCRKGFICKIRVYDWQENIILRHENVMNGAVDGQLDLLAETRLNASPTHGLYTDALFGLEPYMDACIQRPICKTEDYQGVIDVMGIIHDETILAKFVERLKDEQIILADGHHRYAGSLAYMKQQMADNPTHTGNEGYNYHLMWLTNTEANDLRILPTHRLIKGIPNFAEPAIMKKFERKFIIKPVADPGDLHEFILGKPWTFGLIFEENAYAVRLKPDAFPELKWNFPEQIKQLDLTVAHYFIIEEILGIPGKEQTRSDKIEYERNFTKCMAAVMKGKAQMAIITNDVCIEDVKRACGCGCTMPPKSTFFYPKAVCGFLFCSI
ncbi:MAG: DUF1015 domain-containing protein [Deltaproteobacteria bacterium]|jgi:uncharacterized protein (DUF1015 family)|nr:DUF1015 domain-containing protein [Deltaproteobacteria bacterium]